MDSHSENTSSSSPSSSSSSSSSSPARRFLVFGATGQTGIPFIRQAIERGHVIDAYVRNKSKIPSDLVLASPKLYTHEGSIADGSLVESVIDKCAPDAIISLLSSDHNSLSNNATTVINALKNIRNKQVHQDTKKLRPIPYFYIQGWGIEESLAYMSLAGKAMLKLVTLFSDFIPDANIQHRLVKEASTTNPPLLSGTVMLPTILTNGKFTGKYEYGSIQEMGPKMSFFSRITREDMAHCILDLAEKACNGVEIPSAVALRAL